MHTFNPHEPFCLILYLIALVAISVILIKAAQCYIDDCYRKLEEEEDDIYSDL